MKDYRIVERLKKLLIFQLIVLYPLLGNAVCVHSSLMTSLSECPYEVEAGMNQTIGCENITVLLEGQSQNGGNPSWLNSDGIVVSNSSSVIVDKGGKYFFSVNFDDGCVSVDSVTVTIDYEIPFIFIEQVLADPCDPFSFVLDASASDVSEDIRFVWFRPDGSIIATSDLVEEDLILGTYYLESYDESNNCSNLDSFEVINLQAQLIGANAEYSILSDGMYQLGIYSDKQIIGIEWNNADLLTCSDCFNPVAILTQSTTFKIEITYSNSCKEELILYVPVEREEAIYIPNIFSPNGDGTNDVFYIQSREDRRVKQFLIFDRWGNTVAYRENVHTNKLSDGWDGKLNGKELKPGVYMYYIVLENAVGDELYYSGDITILR